MEQLIISTLSGIRRLKGIDQKDLAQQLGVNPVTLSKWEKMRTTPTLAQVVKWCEILGCTIKIEND